MARDTASGSVTSWALLSIITCVLKTPRTCCKRRRRRAACFRPGNRNVLARHTGKTARFDGIRIWGGLVSAPRASRLHWRALVPELVASEQVKTAGN